MTRAFVVSSSQVSHQLNFLSHGQNACCQYRKTVNAVISKRRRTKMAATDSENVPDYVKSLDEDEVHRRRELELDPPESLSDECVEKLRANVPGIARFDRVLERSHRTMAYDPENPAVYSWAYRQSMRRPVNEFVIVFGAVVVYAIARKVIPAAKVAFSKLPVNSAIDMALKFDFWSSVSIGFVVPCMFLLFLRGRDKEQDAMKRLTCIYFFCALHLVLASIVLSTGAVRAAFLSSIFVRVMIIPLLFGLWKDLSSDVKSSTSWISRGFRVWRWLVAIVVCGLGSILRGAILANAGVDQAFALLGTSSSSLRLNLGQRFPVALSLLLDVGGVQCAVVVAYTVSCLYGMYVASIGTNFFQVREHRVANLPLANLLVASGFYGHGFAGTTRRFMETAPSGVKSYRPSSVMLLKRVEGLLTNDSPLLGKEERPAFLDLLDYEKVVMKEKNMKEWMPSRNNFIVPDEKLSAREISFNSLHTWARPLADDQKDMSFLDFFETLHEDEYAYDPELDRWSFTTPPDQHETDKENPPSSGLKKQGEAIHEEGDSDETVFV